MTIDEQILNPFFTWRSAVCSAFGPPSSTTRLTLLTLSLHMNEKGESCFPSIDLLARESALSRKAVIDHLKLAEEAGWIEKQERPSRSGQGWRRMEYSPSIPRPVMSKILDKKGGEPRLPPFLSTGFEGGERGAEGGERDGEKVVNVVHPSTSVNSSKRFTPEDKNQSQNRPLGPPCAHCQKPLTGGHTNMWGGNVCNPCYAAYLRGEWDLDKERAA